MTVYKPMTPRLRKQIDRAYRKQMQELDECENTPYVHMLRTLYGVQRNFLQNLPDGYLIPFTDESKRG